MQLNINTNHQRQHSYQSNMNTNPQEYEYPIGAHSENYSNTYDPTRLKEIDLYRSNIQRIWMQFIVQIQVFYARIRKSIKIHTKSHRVTIRNVSQAMAHT